VRVTSGSDAAGFELVLDEQSTGVYRNTEASGNRLALAAGTTRGQVDRIKVVDEEVLQVAWVDKPEFSYSAMVDRGEWLAIAASEGSEGIQLVDNFNQNIATAKAKMTSDYSWAENGYIPGHIYDPSTAGNADQQHEDTKPTVLNNGCQGSTSCADFLFYSGHGYQGQLTMCEPVNNSVIGVVWLPYGQVANGWAADAEFCIWNGCEILGYAGAPDHAVDDWIQNIFSARPLHAVLATCDQNRAEALDDDFGAFISNLRGGSTVVNAWRNACLAGMNTPYAILVREANLHDYVVPFSSQSASTQLTRDHVGTLTPFLYLWYSGNQKTINPASAADRTPRSQAYRSLGNRIQKAIRFTRERNIEALALGRSQHTRCSSKMLAPRGFAQVRRSESALLAWDDPDPGEATRPTRAASESWVAQRLRTRGLAIPPDYALSSTGRMMAERYVATAEGQYRPARQWCEGEVLTFVRRYRGRPIISDTCTVAVRGSKIALYRLSKHDIRVAGTQTIKEPVFRPEEQREVFLQLRKSIAYTVKQGHIVPVWEIECDNNVFRYDAMKGEPYRE